MTTSSGTCVRVDVGEHLADGGELRLGVGVASRRRRAGSGRRRRPPPGWSGTPRPAGAAGAGRSRRCRPACRSRPSGRLGPAHGRVQGGEQRVLDQHAGAGEPVEQRGLAGVGVAGDGDRRHLVAAGAPGAWCRGPVFISAISRRSLAILVRIRRRSVSILVSPGPRVPMPPTPSRPRHRPGGTSTHPSRAAAAACTASAPARPAPCPPGCLACWAKMSRISAVRSMTLTLTTSSSWLSWPGVSSPSQMTVSAPVATTMSRSSLGLAGADVGRRVGLVAALDQAVEHQRAGGLGQRGQLGQGVLGVLRRALGPDADQHDPLQAQLAVLDLGDVLELGGQAGDPAQRLPVGEVELVAVGSLAVVVARIQVVRRGAASSNGSSGTRRRFFSAGVIPSRVTCRGPLRRAGLALDVVDGVLVGGDRGQHARGPPSTSSTRPSEMLEPPQRVPDQRPQAAPTRCGPGRSLADRRRARRPAPGDRPPARAIRSRLQHRRGRLEPGHSSSSSSRTSLTRVKSVMCALHRADVDVLVLVVAQRLGPLHQRPRPVDVARVPGPPRPSPAGSSRRGCWPCETSASAGRATSGAAPRPGRRRC